MRKFAGHLLVAVLGSVITLGIYTLTIRNEVATPVVYNTPTSPIPAQMASFGSTGLPQVGPDFVRAAEMTVNAVVHIETQYTRKSSVYDLFFYDFYDFFNPRRQSPSRPSPIIATGSGVIISNNGYIVTNNHVVQEAEVITVTLNDRRKFNAKLIGTDPTTDLAVVKIDATNLPYLVYGNSDHVKVGEWVLAVGNPFNLTSTVTAGIVSAKARNINILQNPDGTTIESFIQTDAAVNRGNSGGALVNINGELIGINAAIASGTGYYTGYSFAIPVNIVKKVVEDFIEYGEVQRAFLGVSIRPIDSDFAKENKIDEIRGVYVAAVTDDGGAKQAGIREGDIILAIQGVHVNTTSELLETIGQHRPGDEVEVLIKRGNKEMVYKVVLRNREGNTNIVKKEQRSVLNLLGATFENVPDNTLVKLGIKGGVQVKRLGNGLLRDAGVREGFIVTKIDGKDVRSTEDVDRLLSGKKGGVLIEGVYPNGMKAYYGFGL